MRLRRRPARPDTQAVRTWAVCSAVLDYPTEQLLTSLADLAALVPGHPHLTPLLDHVRRTPLAQLQQDYVATFDHTRKCALYLTYYRYGDTRKRGMSLLAFKNSYRNAGYVPADQELPDYLPMVLDFAALTPRGTALLHAHRADLELLRRALHQAQTPYAGLLDAVCTQLHGLGRRELALVHKAWEEGPPREDVGLEPFAPPEYLTGGAR